jgi:hypothetical protein
LEAPRSRRASPVDRLEAGAGTLDVPEAPLGFATGVGFAHAFAHVMPHGHVEVKSQLVVDGARDAARVELEPEESSNATREHASR